MTSVEAVQFLCAQASVRWDHMTDAEQRTFLQAVMIVAPGPSAELAARALHLRSEADARQGELFATFNTPTAN